MIPQSPQSSAEADGRTSKPKANPPRSITAPSAAARELAPNKQAVESMDWDEEIYILPCTD